ncbi:MAG: hypothetical protein IGS03_18480 [Candidatus Sericytochromatia bacterium]|nr:hypothetical protein [Candidatus Sericytochromatia bacterium]
MQKTETPPTSKNKAMDMHVKCRHCRKYGAYFLGSSASHGNIWCGTSDTEITHDYQCGHCARLFEVWA